MVKYGKSKVMGYGIMESSVRRRCYGKVMEWKKMMKADGLC